MSKQIKLYGSKVLLLGLWDLDVEQYTFTDLKEAKAASKQIIRSAIYPIWWPFCVVRWIEL